MVKKEDARKMYFMGASPNEISKALNLSINTVMYWTYGPRTRNSETPRLKKYWSQERKELLEELDTQRKTVGKAKATKVYLKSLDLIQGCLNSKQPADLDISDAKDLAAIATSMHKVVAIESGEATEIIEEHAKSFTIQDLKNALSKDSFLDLSQVKDVSPKEEPDERIELIRQLAGKATGRG